MGGWAEIRKGRVRTFFFDFSTAYIEHVLAIFSDMFKGRKATSVSMLKQTTITSSNVANSKDSGFVSTVERDTDSSTGSKSSDIIRSGSKKENMTAKDKWMLMRWHVRASYN